MKCGNVLLDRLDYRQAHVKIIDFGRSQSLQAWTSHLKNAEVTTPAYAPPEPTPGSCQHSVTTIPHQLD